MKLQTKFGFLLILCAALLLSLAAAGKRIEKERLDAIFNAEEKAWNAGFDKMLGLVQQSLATFVYDYTYWDDMVAFLKTGDRKWAKDNIETPLSSFKVNAVWIYKNDRTIFYSANNLGDSEFSELPMPWTAIDDLFAKSRFCHFFVRSPKGLKEIRGATIHPTSDPERKTPPLGYLFAGRLWDEKYLDELSSLTGMKVSLVPIAKAGVHGRVSDPKKGLIASSRMLNDWDGMPAMRIDLLRESVGIKAFGGTAGRMVTVIVIYSAILLIVVSVFFAYWINIPLARITKAVMEKKPISEKYALGHSNEFRAMASMMNRFFDQRERLVTEMVGHRKADSQLRLSEEKFAKAFRVNPDPMAIFLSEDGRFLDANEAFLNITGYSRDKVVNHTVEELNIMPKNRHLAFMQALKEHGRLRNVEMEIATASGETRSWLFSAAAIEVGKERIVLAVANDITDRKRAENELRAVQENLAQSEKLAAMGRFAAGLAHEVKNPLAVLLGGLEYLKEKMPKADPDVRGALVKMRSAVTKANTIVKDLLSFAKPSRPIYEKMHPNVLVSESVGLTELLKHKSDTADVSLKQELTGEEIYVEADKNQMQQALFNVLLNAIEAVSAKGEVMIKTYADEMSCVIEVKDTGEGISEENMKKLFEPFFTTKAGRGTGLGLAIVRTIVEQHNGFIDIESEPGKGTTVKIVLPRVGAR
jgi:PAS domain S-box-containing protein